MNNKDFITTLAVRMGLTAKDVQRLSDAFIAEIANNIDEGMPLNVQGFGNFDIRKKAERIVVNPVTKQRMLVPPKLVLGFKPSAQLRDKLK